MSVIEDQKDAEKSQDVILVTGATGNVGRQVVSQLLNSGARIRALSRNPAAAGLPSEVEVVGGDLSLPSSLNECLEGVESVFLLWRSASIATAAAVVRSIAKHARRVVFLSSSAVRDTLERQTDPIGQTHADIEKLIEQSGLEWTFLRPGGFATNSLLWAPQIREGEVVRWPYGGAASAPLHERDIAAVAVLALRDERHNGAKYVLTGPQSLTHVEQVRIIGEVIGRWLHLEEIGREAARRDLLASLPPSIVDFLLDFWSRMVGQPAPVTSTVSEITGAPARTFRDWVRDHAGDFQLASEGDRTAVAS